MSESNPVQPGSARWAELVATGILLGSTRNWFLGDAAVEIAPEAEDSQLLVQYAEQVGVEVHKVRLYRSVAIAWPEEKRVEGTSWKVHQVLSGNRHLIKPGMTLTQASAALGQKNVGRTGPKASTADKAAAVADYLKDPDVVAALPAATKTAFVNQVIHEPKVEPKPYPLAEPDPNVEAATVSDEELIDNRLALAKVINLLRSVHERGITNGQAAIEADLDKVTKWLGVVYSDVDGKGLDEELSEFLATQGGAL
jgi:hypothetical protein